MFGPAPDHLNDIIISFLYYILLIYRILIDETCHSKIL
jgi:hypothetical protein